MQGHPLWIDLGNVSSAFSGLETVHLRNLNPASLTLLSVSIRCDIAEYVNVTIRGAAGTQSAHYTPQTLAFGKSSGPNGAHCVPSGQVGVALL